MQLVFFSFLSDSVHGGNGEDFDGAPLHGIVQNLSVEVDVVLLSQPSLQHVEFLVCLLNRKRIREGEVSNLLWCIRKEVLEGQHKLIF